MTYQEAVEEQHNVEQTECASASGFAWMTLHLPSLLIILFPEKPRSTLEPRHRANPQTVPAEDTQESLVMCAILNMPRHKRR